jgi:hypothetical protein
MTNNAAEEGEAYLLANQTLLRAQLLLPTGAIGWKDLIWL